MDVRSTRVAARQRLAIGAGGVLAALTLASCSAGGGTALEMPDRVGDLWTQAAACEEGTITSDSVAQCLENAGKQSVVTDEAAQRLSAAYGDVPAAGGAYVTPDYGFMADVYAVRAEAPGLWSRFEGDEWEQRTGVRSMQSIESQDGVDCLVMLEVAVQLDEEIAPEDTYVNQCQKSDDGLTVQIFFGAPTEDVRLTVDQVATWLNELHDSLG